MTEQERAERVGIAGRAHCAAEALVLPDDSFKGECRHCGGIVLVPRESQALMLVPDAAYCVFCGQRYRAAGMMIALELATFAKRGDN